MALKTGPLQGVKTGKRKKLPPGQDARLDKRENRGRGCEKLKKNFMYDNV